MTKPPNPVRDPSLPTNWSESDFRNALMEDVYVSQFAKLSEQFVKATSGYNFVTLEQFEPYIPLFKVDQTRLDTDENYYKYLKQLKHDWQHKLGVNPFEITFIIRSKEDPTELGWLQREMTPLRSDEVEGPARRDNIPASKALLPGVTKDDLKLRASVDDLMDANSTEEQRREFFMLKVESMIMTKHFTQRNLSADKRAATAVPEQASEQISPQTPRAVMFDDDD